MTLLTEEKEIASVSNADDGAKVTLTNKRVYQVFLPPFLELLTAQDGERETKIIPLSNIDSFGIITTQKLWLLVIGCLVALFGLYSLVTSFQNQNNFGYRPSHLVSTFPIVVLLVGALLIAGWWLTRKLGMIIYSMSGKTEIFVQASRAKKGEIIKFLDVVQETVYGESENIIA